MKCEKCKIDLIKHRLILSESKLFYYFKCPSKKESLK